MNKLLIALLSLFLLNACVNSGEQSWVYMNSGVIQCESAGRTSGESAYRLTQHNISVNETLCAQLSDMTMVARCGASTTSIHLHRIAEVDLQKAQSVGFLDVQGLKKEDDLGYQIHTCRVR
ncbi:MAG: hypothetical protein V5786_08645 [Psychromonas sp.]